MSFPYGPGPPHSRMPRRVSADELTAWRERQDAYTAWLDHCHGCATRAADVATRYDRWRLGAAGRSRLSRLGERTVGRLASAH
jgi:hypothetical protein